MALYARDAKTTRAPWKRWEYKRTDDRSWTACCDHPCWKIDFEFRRKSQIPRPHPHAKLMALYARDAAETDAPWKRWEKRTKSSCWFQLYTHPIWNAYLEYRRKPQTNI